MKAIIAILILAIGALAIEPQPKPQGRRDGNPDSGDGGASCYACHTWIP